MKYCAEEKMKINPLVSIIIPAYNAETTIEKCVRSVISQKYSNIEIIIVNDGSIDNTILKCCELASSDTRIRVIEQKNAGCSAARNAGLKQSKGDYIAFVDADDILDCEFLSKMMSVNDSCDIDLIMCGITFHYYNPDYQVRRGFNNTVIVYESEMIPTLIRESCCNGMIYSSCNKLYKREIILHANMTFPLHKEPIEDILFNCEYMRFIRSIAVLKECLYIYNKTDNESNVTRYRKNIWVLSNERSGAFQSMFNYWKMNSVDDCRFLADEYVGGKSDCIINCYRVGTDLQFKERVALFDKYIIRDEKLKNALILLNTLNLYFDKRILARFMNIKNPVLFTLLYESMFYCRYRFKTLYYKIRQQANKTNTSLS